METKISQRSTVVAVKDQVSTNVAGEAVILHLGKGIYYGVNPVGARIWNLIQKPKKVAEIQDRLLEEYPVTPRRCQKDLFELLQDLKEHELIEIKDEAIR